jgi:predicted RNA-binding protein YlxR (DUF448 family)
MRLVKTDDEVKIDPKGKLRGRGANISMDIKIFNDAINKGSIERALDLKRKLTDEEVEKLRKDFIKAIEERKFRRGSNPVTVRVGKDGGREVVEE